MPHARYKGKNVYFKLDGVDYSEDMTELNLEPEEADSDVVTFADAAAGGSTDYWLRGTAIQSGDSTAFHDKLWEEAGEEGLTYEYAPAGNSVPATGKPVYSGTVTLGREPAVGGQADTTWTFDFEIKCDQKPTKDVTP